MKDRSLQLYLARSRGLFVKCLLALTDGNKTEAARLAEVTVPAILYVERAFEAVDPDGVAFEGDTDPLEMIVESLRSFTQRAKEGYCLAMNQHLARLCNAPTTEAA